MPFHTPPPADEKAAATGSVGHGTPKIGTPPAACRTACRFFVPTKMLCFSRYTTAWSLVQAGEVVYATIACTQKMGVLVLEQMTNGGSDPRK